MQWLPYQSRISLPALFSYGAVPSCSFCWGQSSFLLVSVLVPVRALVPKLRFQLRAVCPLFVILPNPPSSYPYNHVRHRDCQCCLGRITPRHNPLEHYQYGYDTLRDFAHFRREFTHLVNELNREQIIFRQHVEGTLRFIIDSEYELKEMMDDAGSERWKNPDLAWKLQQKLCGHGEYENYQSSMWAIHDNLASMSKRLKTLEIPVRFYNNVDVDRNATVADDWFPHQSTNFRWRSKATDSNSVSESSNLSCARKSGASTSSISADKSIVSANSLVKLRPWRRLGNPGDLPLNRPLDRPRAKRQAFTEPLSKHLSAHAVHLTPLS